MQAKRATSGTKVFAGIRIAGWAPTPILVGRTLDAGAVISMIGVILAAGVGSRLRPMTNTKPKCLVTTAGKAILQYQIDAYQLAGIDTIIIVVGYEGAAIRDYCKHIKDLDIIIVENVDYEDTNNMYSLHLTRMHVAGRPFILNNADLSIDPVIVNRLLDSPFDNAIAVDRSLYNAESMKVSVNEAGLITNIAKTIAKADAYACSIDFYKFSAQASEIFFAEINTIIEGNGNRKDWTEVAMQQLFQSGRMDFQPCDITGAKWVEIDNYADLAQSDRLFSGLDEKIDHIDNFVFDLDGTLYVGSQPVEGASQAITGLRQQGKQVFFVSNNSSKNKQDYVSRLEKMGIPAQQEDIVLSTDAVVSWLNRRRVEKIHVLGTNSLKKTLLDEGFNIDSADPEFVVIGYDTELSYKKLITACKYINEGTDILATHMDMFCPSEIGPIPDIGATLEMIRLTTGKVPFKVFGKPGRDMIKPLVERFDLDLTRTVVIGDRLHTDIAMAHETGCLSLLVLTGETAREQLEGASVKPTFVLDSVAGLKK